MKLSTVASKVIALGDKILEYLDRELRKRHPDYPIINPGEEPPPPPPEEKKLRKYLESLPEDMLYKLALLAEFAWGNFDPNHLADRYEAVKEKFGPRSEAIMLLMDNVALPEALADGLEELKRRNIDVDTLNFNSVGSGP